MAIYLISALITLTIAASVFHFWKYKMPHSISRSGVEGRGIVEYVLLYDGMDGETYTPIIRYHYNGQEYVNEATECEGILWPGTKGREVYIRIDPKNPNRIYARVTAERESAQVMIAFGIVGLVSVFLGIVSLGHQLLWLAS